MQFCKTSYVVENKIGFVTNNTQWTNYRQSQPGAPAVQRFTGDPGGVRQKEAPTVNKDLTPLSILMLCFLEIIQMLVEKTDS
jgi:hypothetical protein